MKLKKIYDIEAAVNAAIAKNPKRDLFLVLRRAQKQIKKITDEVADSNPLPPQVTGYQRELQAMHLEFNTATTEAKAAMLRALSDKYPTAKTDSMEWTKDQDLLMSADKVFEFENPAAESMAWDKNECMIGCENLAIMIDGGIFTEQ